MNKEKYKKILETYEGSSKIEKLILIDLLKDFLAYNSGVKVEKVGVNFYWFNKYFTHEKLNKFDQILEKELSKKEQEEILKDMILLITGFSELKKNEVFGHIALDKVRKFMTGLKEEINKEGVGVLYIKSYRDVWTRILSDCKILRLSNQQYLPHETKQELKEISNIKDKDDELLSYFQGIVKSYENDLSRDFFNDQDMLSSFYQKSVLRIAFEVKNIQDLLNLIESKENKELRYNSESGIFTYDGDIAHTFKIIKGEKNYKKLLTDFLYSRDKGTYIKYSEILFELGKQNYIYDDLSEGEIRFVERTKDKVNRDIKKKTKDDKIILFSQEKDGNKRYIYRNY